MRVLITGICGFVGRALAVELLALFEGLEILGLDNLSRPGSEYNRRFVQSEKSRLFHGDIRLASDLENLPRVDWIIDAAANPSVLAGLGPGASSRQLMEHNLLGTLNLLEFCKRRGTGLILLSTSRVYSLRRLCSLPIYERGGAFMPALSEIGEPGLSDKGVSELFSTEPPVSLYGGAKLASEILSLEYAGAFDLPVFINRCGVMAGAGQFGRADQGIFSFWIHSYRNRRPLKYLGFKGTGQQVRDCLHPRDLASLVAKQLSAPAKSGTIVNVGGGSASGISLFQLSQWCAQRFGMHPIAAEPEDRPFDVPWLVLDSSKAEKQWNWQPLIKRDSILEEIAQHAEANPHWLELSSGT